MPESPLRIGTAGWSIPREAAAHLPGDGSHLARFARVLALGEINSSFYRPHAPALYAKWAAQVPPGFRFAVKLPKAITHDARLRAARAPLAAFAAEVAGLGDALGALLVQLPPSLVFDARTVRGFLALLAAAFPAVAGGTVFVACEPRHASWFTPAADAVLAAARVARVAADPFLSREAARPGGWLGPAGDGAGADLYWRWHGAPRMYWSRYEDDWLHAAAAELARWPAGTRHWVVFDNTAGGGAMPNALRLQELAGKAVRR